MGRLLTLSKMVGVAFRYALNEVSLRDEIQKLANFQSSISDARLGSRVPYLLEVKPNRYSTEIRDITITGLKYGTLTYFIIR